MVRKLQRIYPDRTVTLKYGYCGPGKYKTSFARPIIYKGSIILKLTDTSDNRCKTFTDYQRIEEPLNYNNQDIGVCPNKWIVN